MGLADRDYARRRTGGAGPGPRGWSFNTWLIAVNIGVFVLGYLLQASAVPVHTLDEITTQTPPSGRLVVPDAYPRGDGTAAPYLVRLQATVRPGVAPAQVWAPAPPALVGRAGLVVARELLVETADGRRERIGYRVYRLMEPLTAYGHFSTAKAFFWQPNAFRQLVNLEVWRLLTFQFLHSGFTHLFFNMFGLYLFGRRVEEQLGFKRYAAFYLMCGICGGLMYLLLNAVGQAGVPLPGALFYSPTVTLVGASAGVFGVIMAAAYIEPGTMIQLLIPPIPLKLRTFAYGYVAFAALNLFIFRGANQGGDAAHVGGAIGGYFFIRRTHLLREFFDVFGNSSKPRGARRGRAPAPVLRRGPASRDAGGHDREVDRILDKIQREGLTSLSEIEKKRLADASAKRRD